MAMDRFAREARRGAMFTDADAASPYLLFFLNASIRRGADEHLAPLSRPEQLGERFAAVRATREGHFEAAPPESLLLLRPHDGTKAGALDLIGLASDLRTQAETFARETLVAQAVNEERRRLEETVEERLRFLERGFEYRKAELAERRSELRQQKRDGAPGAERAYAEIKERQQQLRVQQDEALAVIRREPELIELADLEFVACALVVPSTDPEDKMRRDDEVERIAMREAMAYERARGASVRDVSTPAKARAAGLPDWPGFDVLSEHPETGTIGIEVKGRARIGDVMLHANEWSAAITQRDAYWLYVVFDCATAHPRLLRVQDPYGRLLATPKGDVIIDEQEIFKAAVND